MVIKVRKFYIFNINKEMTILSKNNPYNIYKTLEQIYKMNKKDLAVCSSIYEQLVTRVDVEALDHEIYDIYKNNDYYFKVNNHHNFYNKYRPEETKMSINNSYLVLESNAIFPSFFKYLTQKNSFFACDFENKDYFWLDEIVVR